MKVQVTKADIKYGVRGNMNLCPIALALQRKFPDYSDIIVTRGVIVVGKKGYFTSRKIATFIKRFDAEEDVQPFSFDIDRLPKLEY